MVVTEVKCDRCGKTILYEEGHHTIQWREITNGVDRANHGDFLIADLCCDCYRTVVEQDLAQYGYKPELDWNLLKKGVQNEDYRRT